MARMNGHTFPPAASHKLATLHQLRREPRLLTPAELAAERQIERLIQRAERLTAAELDESIRRGREAYEDAAPTQQQQDQQKLRQCPPCHQNCTQGRTCPVRLAELRREARVRRQHARWLQAATAPEREHPWMWLVYAAVVGAALAASYAWPWGWAIGALPGATP